MLCVISYKFLELELYCTDPDSFFHLTAGRLVPTVDDLLHTDIS